jgi:integrase
MSRKLLSFFNGVMAKPLKTKRRSEEPMSAIEPPSTPDIKPKKHRKTRGEGTLVSTGKGTWALILSTTVNGKRKQTWHRIVARNKSDAIKARTAILRARDTLTLVEQSRMTLAEWLDGWLKGLTVAPATLEGYQDIVRKYLIPAFGSQQLTRLATPIIRAYFAGLHNAAKLAPRSQLKQYWVLWAALRVAVEDGFLSRHPMMTGKKNSFRPPTEKVEMKALDETELLNLHALYAGTRLEALVEFASATAMRLGELLGLRWSDIDYERQRLTVRRSLSQTRFGTVFKSPKNASSQRAVSLDPDAVALLRRHEIRQKEERLRLGTIWPQSTDEDFGLVFPNADGRRWNRKAASAAFRRGRAPIRFHDLRHTHVSILMKHRSDLIEIKDRLGHSSISTTADQYGHLLKGVAEKTAATFGAAMREAREKR